MVLKELLPMQDAIKNFSWHTGHLLGQRKVPGNLKVLSDIGNATPTPFHFFFGPVPCHVTGKELFGHYIVVSLLGSVTTEPTSCAALQEGALFTWWFHWQFLDGDFFVIVVVPTNGQTIVKQVANAFGRSCWGVVVPFPFAMKKKSEHVFTNLNLKHALDIVIP